jgi:hypothetical protein
MARRGRARALNPVSSPNPLARLAPGCRRPHPRLVAGPLGSRPAPRRKPREGRGPLLGTP